MNSLQNQVEASITAPGVYFLKDEKGEILYVGKSTNVRDRLKSHLVSEGEKARSMVSQSVKIEVVPVEYELEALLLEAQLIKKYLPRYNSTAKDDKHPLYIKITHEEYPKITISRKEEGGHLYFGPFPSSRIVKSVLRQIRRVYPFCQQKNIGKRGCLYSHIGLCNPCPSEIVQVQDGSTRQKMKNEYKQNIKNIVKLLSGKHKTLRREMVREMENAAKTENFELASKLRDRIKNLDYITAPYKSPKEYMENPNLLEDIRTQELNLLYDLLKLKMKYLRKIKRIECFDISHTGSKSTTASMVTFVNGEPDKNLYRRFKIRTVIKADDTSSMLETFERRLKHITDWGLPQLFIVDGGKGQVAAALEALKENNIEIPVIGIAKRLEEIIIPKSEGGYTIVRLSDANPALHLLQRIRDEAHRFARKYHFSLRMKSLVTAKNLTLQLDTGSILSMPKVLTVFSIGYILNL